jgi:hypothetical protein
MRYTFMLYSREADFANATPKDMEESLKAFGEYIGALRQAGVFVDTDWLMPTATATTVTLRGGAKKVQDGPFAEIKEQLGGYFVVEVPDLDAALKWAEKCPAAHYGMIEVRASAMPAGQKDGK